MSQKNDGGPAFPVSSELVRDIKVPLTINECCGLSKRELFAAMAMQGLLSNPNLNTVNETGMAREACVLADALLEELQK